MIRSVYSKRVRANLVSSAAILLVCQTAMAADHVVWRSDFQSAWEEAQNLDKPVLMHFYADWCGPCQQMEHNVLNNASLLNRVDNGFVAIKINSDRHPELVSRFGIKALPTDLFVDPDGTVLSQNEGYTPLRDYLTRLTRIESDFVRSRKTRVVARSTGQSEATEPPEATEQRPNSEAPSTAVADTGPDSRSPKPSVPPAVTSPHEMNEAAPQIGLDGYCPVSLHKLRKWQKGNPLYAAEYQGVTYYLATAKNLKEFNANPAKFAPRLLGCDPVILWKTDKARLGSVDFAAYFDDDLFLFADAATREAFRQNPVRYTRIRSVLRDELIGDTRIR